MVLLVPGVNLLALWRFPVFFLLVSGVVLVVLEGFQWVLLVSWLVLLVLGNCQWFSLVTGVFLLILGGFQSF